jgi:PAS domain S-box-containing protein
MAAATDAIAEQLPVKAYTVENGLAHNRVTRIVQDSRGFLWFCTADGLSRFDGNQFTNYRMEDGLLAPSINDIAETSDDVYWVATNSDGVFRFDLRATTAAAARGGGRSRFTRYPVGTEPVTNRVNVLYRDPGGILWAGTDGGLFALNEARGEQVFSPVALRIPLRPDIQVQVWTLVKDRSGSLWIGTKYGLVRRLPDGGMAHVQIQPSAGEDNVSALMMASDGKLWVAHQTAGLIAFNPESAVPGTMRDASRPLPADARRYTTKDGLENNLVLSVRQSADGRIWIRTFGSGVTGFDGKVFRTYWLGPRAINATGALTEDREGNLWLSSNSGGALKITKQGWTTYGEPEGLGASVTSIFETQAGDLYVSSRAWLVSQFRGGRFTTVRPGLPAAITDASWRDVNNVLLDHAGEWWIGTRAGLYRFGKTRRFEDLARARPAAVYTTRDGLANDDVTRVFEDSRGDVWIASWTPAREPAVRWERATGRFHRYSDRHGLRPFTSVVSFGEDAAGNVWAGLREGGLARYRAGRFTMLARDDGLPVGGVNAIYRDPSGRLWAAVSRGGLYRIDNPEAERPRVVAYTTADGLAADVAAAVTGDSTGRIYVATPRGVDRLDPTTGQIRHYSTANGLTGGEFKAALRDRNGALWFCTTTGLSRFVPELDERPSPPPVLIGAVRVAGVPRPLSALGETTVSAFELPTDQNNIQIDFFGIGFRTGEALRFQYKLDGAGADWSSPSSEHTVNYASLAPGAYRFLVRAVATDGIQSQSPAVVSFEILQPVWRRWWFVVMAVAIAASAGAAFARSRHKQMRTLRDSENRFRTLAETASDAIITIDERSRIVLVNQAAEKVFGYTRQEMIGAELTMLMPESLRHRHHTGFGRYMQTGERNMSWEAIELPGLHKSGHEVPLEISFGEFKREGRRYFTGIARDITERRRAEDALRRSREERMAELERVRKRIATDLHDDIGSSLTRISLLGEVVSQRASSGDRSLAEPLASIANLSRELVDCMSDIVWAINPNKDHLRDLSQRMRHFASDVFTARQIEFRFLTPDPDRDIRVGADIRREVFLVFKEAVNNVVRHSVCSHAELEFRAGPDGLVLVVSDNGRGFDVAGAGDGHGLLSMRERTEGLGGRFEVLSQPGTGTLLTFTIPFADLTRSAPRETAARRRDLPA